MRKIINITLIGLVAIMVIVSCKRSQINDLSPLDSEVRNISGEGIIAGNVTMDNESVKVPFKITLSGPAKKAFQVALSLNNDTVNQLIKSGTLTNTLLMPNGSVDFPNVINIKFGADSATGIAIVRLSTLERNYGKNLAFALKLVNPEKGNKITSGKSNILVVLNTSELFKESDIHYLTLSNGGGIKDVNFKGDYVTTPAGVTIPITINLANQAGLAFNVNVKLNRDTIATLVANKVLPANTIQLADKYFTMDTLIRVNFNENTATIRLSIPWPVFDANIQANKRFAFAISLSNPTKHALHPTKSKVIVLVQPEVNFDNNSYITGNGTGLKAEYFSNYQLLDGDGRAPTTVRIDETIDFGGDGWPDNARISRDNYSSRWTGEFLAPVRGDYIFYQTRWDDGSRLFINGKAIINDFTQEWDKDYRKATIRLERGVRYKIEAHHRENVGGQQAHLEYEVPSAGINGKRTVPKSQLFPAQ